MQGIKIYQEKLCNNFQLIECVQVTNFYRCLKEVLQVDFLYVNAEQYYDSSGQKSIDTMAF